MMSERQIKDLTGSQVFISGQMVDVLSGKGCTHVELVDVINKLQGIKKSSAFNIFKKKTEPLEEDVLDRLGLLLEKAPEAEVFKFLLVSQTDIEILMGLSFDPNNKNRKLADQAIEICIKIGYLVAEVFVDCSQERRVFKQRLEAYPEIYTEEARGRLADLFEKVCCFFSTVIENDPKFVKYKLKKEKLKSFRSIESRLQEKESDQKVKELPVRDCFDSLKALIRKSLSWEDEDRMLTMTQAWFEVLGRVLEKGRANNIEVRHENFHLELSTRLKNRRRLFDLLEHYFELLLECEEHQLGLMGLMEKSIAKYINLVLNAADNATLDRSLFEHIFELINKLFLRRKKLFGLTVDGDEFDNFMSGMSNSEEKVPLNVSTLSKELNEELHSFRYLQSMTGKLYLRMIDKLMEEKSEYKVFALFVNNEAYVSFLEIFEAHYSQKLFKKILSQFLGYVEDSLRDRETKERLFSLLKVGSCDERVCRCFVSELLNIFFKLSLKCPLSNIKTIMQMYLGIVKGLLSHESAKDRLCECYLRSFTKTFTSLLQQNFETVDKMTVQLMAHAELESDGEGDAASGLEIHDLRHTKTISSRKFNLFCETITINAKPVRLTKEMCESVLIILSNLDGVLDFLSSEHYTIDLDLHEDAIVAPEDVIAVLQDRWQVRLLNFRSVIVETSALILKELYHLDSSKPVFTKFWRFFNEELFKLRGKSLHSFYMGFITRLFTKHFNLTNYNSENFYKYLVILDVYLKGLGYYDRDCRLPIPSKIHKEWFAVVYELLRIKTDVSNTRLTAVQMLVCCRLADMLTRDPPVLKVLVPLVFSALKELSSNFGQINAKSRELVEGLEVILDEAGVQVLDGLLLVQVKLFTGLFSLTWNYPAMPVVLKPFVLRNSALVHCESFNAKYFGDIRNWLLSVETVLHLIKLVDSFSFENEPQKKLAKYVNLLVQAKPDILPHIFERLTIKCLDPGCQDEVFKLRMKMFVSFLTIEENCIANSKTLEHFIDHFEALLLSLIANRQERNVKKQWFFIVLVKWLYLSTDVELPIYRIKTMVSKLKSTGDTYIIENSIIFESYLASIRGLFGSGPKALRDSSIFDEANLMSRKKLVELIRMIEKFVSQQPFEEEARLLQNNFELNLFEFFSQDKQHLTFNKIFELLIQKVKQTDLKWLYLFDDRHCILYSLAETDLNEVCVVKRHIAGKTCWFAKESFDGLYVQRDRLEVLGPDASAPEAELDPADSLLSRLLDEYRARPGLFDASSPASIDEDVLKLASNCADSVRCSSFDTYPDLIKLQWSPAEDPSQPVAAGSSITPSCGASGAGLPEASEDSDSFIGSFQRQSDSSASGRTAHDPRPDPSERVRTSSLTKSSISLKDARLRFIIQNGLYTSFNPEGPTAIPYADYHLISLEQEEKDVATRFKNSLSIFDKTGILNCFKVGILFIGPDQENEEKILANPYPERGLFVDFVSSLGEQTSESTFERYLGNDVIQYQIGPLIPRKAASTFEVKRIVGNRPSLIIWSQNPRNINYEGIKSKFNRDIIIVEELHSGLLKVRSLRKIEDSQLEAVYRPDALMNLCCLQRTIHSYIFGTQMEINPKILNSLEKEYKTISPYLEARKKKLRDLKCCFEQAARPLTLETLTDLVFHK